MASLLSQCPERVWIGTVEFALNLVPAEHEKLDGGESDGCSEWNPPALYVCNSLRLSELLETMWHELTHAVDFVSDIEDGAIEEDIADKHAKVWSQFWINNPSFQRWWTQACVAIRRNRQSGGKTKHTEGVPT